MAAGERNHEGSGLAGQLGDSLASAVEDRGGGDTLLIFGDPRVENHLSTSPPSAVKPGTEAPVGPSLPRPDETDVRLLIDFFLLLQKWDDTLQSKCIPAGVLPPARETAA
jgi:hypothetical protein